MFSYLFSTNYKYCIYVCTIYKNKFVLKVNHIPKAAPKAPFPQKLHPTP